jgi:hypothetical protein
MSHGKYLAQLTKTNYDQEATDDELRELRLPDITETQ